MTASTKRILSAFVVWCMSLAVLGSMPAQAAQQQSIVGLSVGVSTLEEFRAALQDPDVYTITLGHSIQLQTTQQDWDLQSGAKVVLGASGASLTLPKKFDLQSDTAFDQLTLLGAGGGTNIFAQGNTLVLGQSVETPFEEGHFIAAVYGGAYGRTVSGDTDLIIRGGDIPAVYGAGHDGDVTGSTRITLGQSASVRYLDGGGSGYNDVVTGDRWLVLEHYGSSGDFRPAPDLGRFNSLGTSGTTHVRLGASGLPDGTQNLELGGGVLWLDGDVALPGVSLGSSGGALQLTSGSTVSVGAVGGDPLPVLITGAPQDTLLQAPGLLADQLLPPEGYEALQDGPNGVALVPLSTRIPASLTAWIDTEGYLIPLEVILENGARWQVQRVLEVSWNDPATSRYFARYALQVDSQTQYLYADLSGDRLVWYTRQLEQ